MLRILIEIDSVVHHSSKLDLDADRRRDAVLAEADFRVVRVTGDQVWFRPREAVAVVRRASAAA